VLTKLDSAIVSLEAYSLEWPVAARHRFAVFRPDLHVRSRVRISDVLLFDGGAGTDVTSEAEAVPLALPRSTLQRSERVGLYWELYGLREGETPEFELSVVPTDSSAGFLRSLAQSIGLVSRRGTVLTRWQGASVSASAIGAFSQTEHSIIVDLTSLRPGHYQLELSTSLPGDAVPVRATKAIRVR
jgi:hypothetical protein